MQNIFDHIYTNIYIYIYGHDQSLDPVLRMHTQGNYRYYIQRSLTIHRWTVDNLPQHKGAGVDVSWFVVGEDSIVHSTCQDLWWQISPGALNRGWHTIDTPFTIMSYCQPQVPNTAGHSAAHEYIWTLQVTMGNALQERKGGGSFSNKEVLPLSPPPLNCYLVWCTLWSVSLCAKTPIQPVGTGTSLRSLGSIVGWSLTRESLLNSRVDDSQTEEVDNCHCLFMDRRRGLTM